MAEVIHRYVPAKERKPSPERANQAQLEANRATARAEILRVRRQQAEMLLAKARGELIMREKVILQASYLLRSLQQKVLPRAVWERDSRSLGS